MNSHVRTPLLGLLGIVSAFGAYACGSSSDTTPGGTTTLPDGGVVVNDSGTTGDASDKADAAPTTKKNGTVVLSQLRAGGVYLTNLAASFYDGPTVQQTPGTCTTTTYGGCTLTECVTASTSTDAGAPPNAISAGDVTVTGGLLAPEGITSSPDKSGTYAATSQAKQSFGGGETLTVKALGADGGVPAFDGKTAVAPSEIVVTPALSTVTPTNVSRTTAYKFDWTGGGAGDVTLILNTTKAGERSETILCKAVASAGTITVPQEAVAKLLATQGQGFNGTISATPTNMAKFAAGDVPVSFVVVGPTLSGSMTTN